MATSVSEGYLCENEGQERICTSPVFVYKRKSWLKPLVKKNPFWIQYIGDFNIQPYLEEHTSTMSLGHIWSLCWGQQHASVCSELRLPSRPVSSCAISPPPLTLVHWLPSHLLNLPDQSPHWDLKGALCPPFSLLDLTKSSPALWSTPCLYCPASWSTSHHCLLLSCLSLVCFPLHPWEVGHLRIKSIAGHKHLDYVDPWNSFV